MTFRSLAAGLIILFFCLLNLASAEDAVWDTPGSGADVLVLNAKYLVKWQSDWTGVNLYVFCNGVEYGGVGENGADRLRGK